MERRSDTNTDNDTDTRYRVAFALMTIAGNVTRYQTTRPLVDADPTIDATWFPIATWKPNDWVHALPGMSRVWARHLLDSKRLLLGRSPDALVIHAFETFGLYTLRTRVLRSDTVIVYNPDALPDSGLHRIAFPRTDLFVPWSTECRDRMYAQTDADISDRTRVLHPGIDLTTWDFDPPDADRGGDALRLLFVGGDFERKGGPTLLDAFTSRLAATGCRLTVVTQRPFVADAHLRVMEEHPAIELVLDMSPGTAAVRDLYRRCDALVLPTRLEGLPWVLLEAMASGVPVISTLVNGIPDVVTDGVTGLALEVDDAASIVRAVERLRSEPNLRASLVRRGREHVERTFDARVNTATLMQWTKDLVDERRR